MGGDPVEGLTAHILKHECRQFANPGEFMGLDQVAAFYIPQDLVFVLQQGDAFPGGTFRPEGFDDHAFAIGFTHCPVDPGLPPFGNFLHKAVTGRRIDGLTGNPGADSHDVEAPPLIFITIMTELTGETCKGK